MAELAVSGPLGEGNLADKLRPDPVHAPLGRVGEEPGQSGFRPGDLLAGLVRHPDPEPCRELGSAWTRRFRPVSADRIWLEVALVPSAPAERFVDPAHISGLSGFFKAHSQAGALPHPVFKSFEGQLPEVLRGRLRLKPRANSTALAAYADGRVYITTEVGWATESSVPVLNFTVMEYWLLSLLHAAARYSEWTGAYGDADVLVVLAGPRTIVPSTVPLAGRYNSFPEARERTDTAPVHATSTLDALASNVAQLQACARRIASDLLADLGYVETTLLKPDSKILSGRLDPAARQDLELWMRGAGLPIDE